MVILSFIIHSPKEKKPKGEQSEINLNSLVIGTSADAAQNIRNTSLVIGREFNARVKKRSFAITTVILVILVIVVAFVPTVIQVLTTGPHYKMTLVNNAGVIAGQDATQFLDFALNTSYDSNGKPQTLTGNNKNFDIKTASLEDVANLRQQVSAGKLDILLIINRDTSKNLSFEYDSHRSNGDAAIIQVQSVATQLSFVDKLGHLGISGTQLTSLYQAPPFDAKNLNQSQKVRSPAEWAAAYTVSIGGIVLIFTAIITYGMAVAQGAAEEKSNRVMEIMINAATPFQLMLGKIVGIGLSGFLQIAIVTVVGVIAFLVQTPIKEALLGSNNSGSSIIDITNLSIGLLVLMIIYFVLGFFLYSTLYAAIGSVVSRQEDLQTAVSPLTFIFMIGYFAAIFALNVPDKLWIGILSFVPLFTPMLMLARAALSTLEWWEVPLSIVIMVISILAFTWVAARIYRAGVLMYGQRPSFKLMVKLVISK